MLSVENPCLSLAIARLSTSEADNFAIWVIKAPYHEGYVHHNSPWPQTLTQTWLAWQQMFSLGELPHIPLINYPPKTQPTSPLDSDITVPDPAIGYGGRLMQRLGIELWQWLFAGPIQTALAESRGIARGQNKPLRLRLEIRHPDFIPLPWEIMQDMAGKPAVSLSPHLLFSRTTSNVDSLQLRSKNQQTLKVLLVLGQDTHKSNRLAVGLQLEEEAAALEDVFKALGKGKLTLVPCHVDKLLQPTRGELIDALEKGDYNIVFYAGHGEPGPDGGLLFLNSEATINGTELAQVLVRNQVTLAVFNACWGAQPETVGGRTIPRSSLAEVLIHHGVPAVLGMRDSIADRESLSFIKSLAQSLAERMPIEQAVAVARQQLLTLYKFNQPAWTLPVLYVHPEFNGELIAPIDEVITEFNLQTNWDGPPVPLAYLRSVPSKDKVWRIFGGLMRVGRSQENDLVMDKEMWVSYKHAEIICREVLSEEGREPTYFIRDFSRNGTHILLADGWQRIHHEEVPLKSGTQLKFGSAQGEALEFVIEG
ncbi:MAG TPA: hypothetical protein DEG17_00795 [Cyanobacteria bacterium UBA11149]|nr:hypothetical protein [Cyanobacteria bacterium UBA11367]HBE57793.1 hypothetical protein [Cyanobacteria bacterium UBA11366]HBR73426.1 hypothetical protein [Cyanobacteria bacterium UBA11159]HBS68497.1 hypothetical protein [Cyanobacteria bacterium UBA11153]HBW87451.1 hypothetical protein [Cyanobacteria bacterium UBA11149]